MKQYNYKCVVAKNGTKIYYKRVHNKWKRIGNKVGMKAEKGKKKYEITTNLGKRRIQAPSCPPHDDEYVGVASNGLDLYECSKCGQKTYV